MVTQTKVRTCEADFFFLGKRDIPSDPYIERTGKTSYLPKTVPISLNIKRELTEERDRKRKRETERE